MLNFYYSEDLGLLDNRARRFRDENPNFVGAKNPDPGELHLILSQRSMVEESNSLLIEGYSGPLDSLPEILSSVDLGEKNVLFLVHSESDLKLPKGLLELCENEEVKLNALNERTKRSYIGALIRENKIKLSPALSKLVKDSLPARATDINDFISKISCLDAPRLSEQNLREILGEIKVKVDYFSFLHLYLRENMEDWVLFFNGNVVCEECYRKLFHSLVYKLMDLKKFLVLKRELSDIKKIAARMKTQYYFLFESETAWKLYGDGLLARLDEFIISLYFFICHQTQNRSMNPDLFRCFLLRRRIKLIKVD